MLVCVCIYTHLEHCSLYIRSVCGSWYHACRSYPVVSVLSNTCLARCVRVCLSNSSQPPLSRSYHLASLHQKLPTHLSGSRSYQPTSTPVVLPNSPLWLQKLSTHPHSLLQQFYCNNDVTEAGTVRIIS